MVSTDPQLYPNKVRRSQPKVCIWHSVYHRNTFLDVVDTLHQACQTVRTHRAACIHPAPPLSAYTIREYESECGQLTRADTYTADEVMPIG